MLSLPPQLLQTASSPWSQPSWGCFTRTRIPIYSPRLQGRVVACHHLQLALLVRLLLLPCRAAHQVGNVERGQLHKSSKSKLHGTRRKRPCKRNMREISVWRKNLLRYSRTRRDWLVSSTNAVRVDWSKCASWDVSATLSSVARKPGGKSTGVGKGESCYLVTSVATRRQAGTGYWSTGSESTGVWCESLVVGSAISLFPPPSPTGKVDIKAVCLDLWSSIDIMFFSQPVRMNLFFSGFTHSRIRLGRSDSPAQLKVARRSFQQQETWGGTELDISGKVPSFVFKAGREWIKTSKISWNP